MKKYLLLFAIVLICLSSFSQSTANLFNNSLNIDNNTEYSTLEDYEYSAYTIMFKLNIGNKYNRYFTSLYDYGLSLIHGYQFKNHLYLGLLTGIKGFDYAYFGDNSLNSISAAAYVKYYLFNKQLSPIIEFSYGFEHSFQGGRYIDNADLPLYSAGLGIQYILSKKSMLNVSIGIESIRELKKVNNVYQINNLTGIYFSLGLSLWYN